MTVYQIKNIVVLNKTITRIETEWGLQGIKKDFLVILLTENSYLEYLKGTKINQQKHK